MLSVVVIAKNEAHNIGRCLESVQWADELIVLDSGSKDATVSIAREFTPHVHQTDWQGYGVQKQRALAYATSDWVLNRIPIRLCFYGKPLRFSSSPTRHVRLFKREGADYSADIVHEKIVLPPEAKIGRLKHPIIHHSYKDVSHVLEKINRYSSYSAKIRLVEKRKKPFVLTLLGTMWMFFRCYILQGGIWDGREGFLFAVFNALGTFFRGVKQIYPDLNQAELPVVLLEGED